MLGGGMRLSRRISVQSVRGMHDKLEKETFNYQQLISRASKVLDGNGYSHIMPNHIEEQDVFVKSLGQETDIVEKEMYFVTTTSGDNKYVLRPELTASVARIAIEHKWAHDLPKKIWYHGALFRHERPQKGRYRQFYQLGIESLGGRVVQSDLEVLHSGIQVLQQISLNKLDLEVEINTIGDLTARSSYKKQLTSWLKQPSIFNLLSEEDKKRSETNPLRVLDSKDFERLSLASEAPRIEDHLSVESKHTFASIGQGLDDMGIAYSHNPTLVRGLDYYNDFCFEVKPAGYKANKQGTLIGGGRYDGLAGVLAKDSRKSILAVGWSMGIERVLMALADLELAGGYQDNVKDNHWPLLFIQDDPNVFDSKVFAIRARLLEKFPSASIEIVTLKPGKVGQVIGKLAEKHSRVFIVGPDELEHKQCQLKDLRNNTQESINI